MVWEHETTLFQGKECKRGSSRGRKGEGSSGNQGGFQAGRVVTDSSFREISLVACREGARGGKTR